MNIWNTKCHKEHGNSISKRVIQRCGIKKYNMIKKHNKLVRDKIPEKYFSFVIPANTKKVAEIVKSIISLDGWNFKNYELIILINNCSSRVYNDLLELFSDFIKRGLIINFLGNSNIAKARNEGISMAKGEYVVHIDSDCSVNSNYLKILKKHSIREKFEVGRGVVKFVPSDALLSSPSCELKRRAYYRRKNITYTPNLVVKRELYKKIGLFNERLFYGEDVEWGCRLEKFSISPVYFNDLILFHFDPDSNSKIIKTYFRYGIDRFYRFKKYIFPSKTFINKIKSVYKLFTETPGLEKLSSIKDRIIIIFLFLVRSMGVIFGFFKWTFIDSTM